MGAGDAFIAGGVESMTMVPQGGFNFSPNPRFAFDGQPGTDQFYDAYISMGQTAENVAARHGIAREDQERLAVDSHAKAARAQADGLLAGEIVPVVLADGSRVEEDGCIRAGTSLEVLAGLKPAFAEDGSVTAGTASPLTDGAVATLVTSDAFAAKHGLPVLARIRASAVAGVEPEYMGMGPVPATRKALARAGLSVDDLDVVEINEAFGSQAVACIKELRIPREVVNIDGGALALGHPLGLPARASRARRRRY